MKKKKTKSKRLSDGFTTVPHNFRREHSVPNDMKRKYGTKWKAWKDLSKMLTPRVSWTLDRTHQESQGTTEFNRDAVDQSRPDDSTQQTYVPHPGDPLFGPDNESEIPGREGPTAFYTVKEFAALARVTENTVRRWMADPEVRLPHLKIRGHRVIPDFWNYELKWKIHPTQLKSWIMDHSDVMYSPLETMYFMMQALRLRLGARMAREGDQAGTMTESLVEIVDKTLGEIQRTAKDPRARRVVWIRPAELGIFEDNPTSEPDDNRHNFVFKPPEK